MLGVQIAHRVGEALPDKLVVLRHLADEQARVDRVLVSHVVARKVAVAFLEAEDEAVGLPGIGKLGDDIADVLEAGQATAQLETVLRGERIDHGARYDGGDRHLVGEVFPARGAHAAYVVEQKHAHLVASEQQVVIAVLHGHAHAVGVGIGGEQEVGMHALGKLDALLHGLADLRVRVRARREVPVGVALLGNHGDIGYARAFKHRCHGDESRAVERRVHELERGLRDFLGG